MPPAAPPPPVNVAYLDGTVYNNPKRYKDNLGGPNGFKPKKDPIPGPPIPVAAGKPVFDIVVEPEYVPDPFPVPYPYPVEEDYDDNLYLTSGDGDNDHDRPPADQGDPLPSQSPGGRRKKPKYKRTNYIERSEPEWSCPREYTEEGRRCVQFDVVDVEIGCVDGWEYRNGECIAIDIQLPEMVCPEEFEKIGDRCTRSIIAPKQMICPENQIHTIHGCKQNVVAEPAIQCIGSTMSQGVCQRTIRMRPDPQCTLGFKLGGDERTCFKESVTSGQTTCLDQFSFDEHGMCERMVVGDVLATCPHGYTRDNFTCHRKVVHPALRTCDFGLMSEDGTCLSTKSLGRPMAACPHGAVLNAYMKCEATAKHPISKSKKKKEACDTGFKQTGDECVKTLFMEPSYSCDGGATLVGSECVSTISSAVLLSCLPGQTLDGDACYYDEATTTSTSCAPGFDLTLDGKCLKREVTNPQLACPQGYRPGVDAMCHQIEKIEATLNCPVTTSLILEDDTYICHGIETVQPDYTCPIPGLALETTATGPKCTGWQVNEPTFVCAPGFTNEGNKCVKLEAASKLPVCPAEYSLSFDSCLRELQQPALYFCPDGYVHQRKAQTCTRKKYTDLIPVCPTDMEYDKLVGECYRLKTDYEFDEPLKTGGDPPDEALKDLDVTTPSPSTEETTLAPAAEGPMGGYPPLPPMAGYPPIGHHHLAAALPPPQLTIVQQPVVVPQPAVILPQQAPVPPPPAIRVPYGVPQPVPTPVRPLEHHKVINQSMSTVINPSMYGSAGGKKHA
ncbi:putative oocyst wall protein [Gregarina niphandrodes]|uniref:Oocyst wall protein n=1 Tax=Gregarina niphandrodes TaxID=110365 RepID=A0A023B9K2_GRENI|nr:putative oocyst wall protein [Gregarina niphandrodes]EZG72988.1 putative oocyst wall protein [Gregarina niphandrodes]|eukprot:XP_011129683.1 putative oocyst wall protein [Gregarina niphandrodes]